LGITGHPYWTGDQWSSAGVSFD